MRPKTHCCRTENKVYWVDSREERQTVTVEKPARRQVQRTGEADRATYRENFLFHLSEKRATFTQQ